LRSRAREITREELASTDVQRLIDDMIDTKRDANGAGIAANQVGSLLRIAVCRGPAGRQPALPVQAPDPASP